MTDMTALSLFSGIGGIDSAAEAAGIRTAAMCEKDPFCRAVLRKHWPDVPIFEDVKKLRGEDIGAAIDVIHGGPPCQAVSLAGRRRGKDDERYLWGEVFRLVADIMPRFCVFENVPGILSIAADEICQELERIGYSVGICCFEAAAVGAPHRRARVFFVAHSRRRMREGGSVAGEIRGEPETRPSPDIERSGGAPLADAKSERRRLRDYCQDIGTANREIDSVGDPSVLRGDVSYADGNGCSALEESYRFSRTNGPIGDSGAIPDADCKWKLQQSRGIAKVGERFGDVCETPANPDSERREEQRRTITEDGERAAFKRSERCCRWESESGLGRNIDGLSPWLHGDWERGILRVAKGAKNRVARLRALGNAVVPAQIYPIFRAIAEIEGRDE